jgi:plasmid replication initiation protein
MGLKYSDHDPEWDQNDILLIYRYGDGSCDTVTENNQHMHATLYDLYQDDSLLHDGDEFTIDGVVVYRCEDVHVTKVD